MTAFEFVNGSLHCEQVPLEAIAAHHGTPCWVYSRNAIGSAYREFAHAAQGRAALISYAVKANSNLAILHDLAGLGAGFDIVSGGELARVLAAGGRADRTLFSGVGKTRNELEQALSAGVRCFNVESEQELERLEEVAAAHGAIAPVSLRVNPDVDPKTHPYISTGMRGNKFGIAHEHAIAAYRRAAELQHLKLCGIDCHIGSQILSLTPFLDALDKVLDLVDALAGQGVALTHLDLGGGLGIRYEAGDAPPGRAELLNAVFQRIDRRYGRDRFEVMFEFGRSIVGEAGALLTRVEYLKSKGARNFAVLDCAMNDLIRPALYDAWHPVMPLRARAGEAKSWDLVGPVCESGDWLARERLLTLEQGDLLAIMSAGAYGMAQSSNYNTRPRAAEVLVDGATMHLVREREKIDDLWRGERIVAE